MNLTQASDYYVEGLITKTTNKEDIFFVLLFISALSLILAMSFLFPILIKSQNDCLIVFFEFAA